jgi:peptidoglycan/xylan/chitin deacetylase (PgdA/CDA1 family)
MTHNYYKNIILDLAEKSGFLNIAQNVRGPKQYGYILAYHRVDELSKRPWLDPHLISANPDQFEEQMKFIANNYHPITAENLLESFRSDVPLPKDSVLVTFDDGYRDFKEVAFPICSHYKIQPLLFQPTAFVGAGNFWWDKLYQIIYLSGVKEINTPVGTLAILNDKDKFECHKKLIWAIKHMSFDLAMPWIEHTHSNLVSLTEEQNNNTLTWDELRQLIQAGISVGGHSHTHPILTQISREEVRNQVIESQELFRRELGKTASIFAFPDGKALAFNQNLIELISSLGYEILFSLMDGRAKIHQGKTNFILPRLSVWRSQTLPQFHMRLTPLIDILKNLPR